MNAPQTGPARVPNAGILFHTPLPPTHLRLSHPAPASVPRTTQGCAFRDLASCRFLSPHTASLGAGVSECRSRLYLLSIPCGPGRRLGPRLRCGLVLSPPGTRMRLSQTPHTAPRTRISFVQRLHVPVPCSAPLCIRNYLDSFRRRHFKNPHFALSGGDPRPRSNIGEQQSCS